jgi:ribosomal protein L32
VMEFGICGKLLAAPDSRVFFSCPFLELVVDQGFEEPLVLFEPSQPVVSSERHTKISCSRLTAGLEFKKLPHIFELIEPESAQFLGSVMALRGLPLSFAAPQILLRFAFMSASIPSPATGQLLRCLPQPLLYSACRGTIAVAVLPLLSDIWDSILPAVPKKKTSYMKKRHRQMAGKALKDAIDVNTCSGCGQPKRAHLLCPTCVSGMCLNSR